MIKRQSPIKRTFDARPDTMDFRDQMFVPSLIEVPTRIDVNDYLAHQVPVLDQGTEGACTGFGLATAANYLLRCRKVVSDKTLVSPRMLYEMARRYDEWPGEDYSGSSARGAMKGWNKHGVCAELDWPYKLKPRDKQGLTEARAAAARLRPLGAYFRVNHQDLIAMHAAIAEVGILYATATVHEGWDNVGSDGIIVQSDNITGDHAFAVVAYDAEGFWIQNSWTDKWGMKGLGKISYDDWLENATDVWVARLGAPVQLNSAKSFATAHAKVSAQSNAYSYSELRPHIVSLGNEGKLKPGGTYGTSANELEHIFQGDFPRIMGQPGSAKAKRILIYVHGGLTSEDSAVQRVADYLPFLLDNNTYPLSFVWHSDYWSTIANTLRDAVRRRRPEGALNDAKDFMLDRLDDALEPVARMLTGKLSWDEMKENALAASSRKGGARIVARQLAQLKTTYPELEIHVVGHSAGAIFLAPFVQLIASKKRIDSGPLKGEKGCGLPIRSCTLWAPACTIDLFNETYAPAIERNEIERFALFLLSDETEQCDDCANIYNKSLLYLVSNSFEKKIRIPFFRDGIPILGMEKFITGESGGRLMELVRAKKAELVIAPNNHPFGSTHASAARHHGDFDDDRHTVLATFARMTSGSDAGVMDTYKAGSMLQFNSSRSTLREKRANIDLHTRLKAL